MFTISTILELHIYSAMFPFGLPLQCSNTGSQSLIQIPWVIYVKNTDVILHFRKAAYPMPHTQLLFVISFHEFGVAP